MSIILSQVCSYLIANAVLGQDPEGVVAPASPCIPTPTNPCSPRIKSKVAISVAPGQEPPDIVHLGLSFFVYDRVTGGLSVVRGALENTQQAYGYFEQPCGGFSSAGAVPYSYLSGLHYPFRDFLNGVCSQPLYPPGQCDDHPDNGTILDHTSTMPTCSRCAAWEIQGVIAQQNWLAYGTGRCNPFNGDNGPLDIYDLALVFSDFTPRFVTVEMQSCPGQNFLRETDGTIRAFDLRPASTQVAVNGASAAGCVQWLDRRGPARRQTHGMVFDSARGVGVMFGGYQWAPGDTFLNDTWQWDGTSWRNITPPLASQSPSARSGFGMAYDSTRASTVIFGGYATNAYTRETWEFDGSVWNLRSTLGPPACTGSAMAFHPGTGRTYLFGGDNGTSYYAFLYAWNGTSWSFLAPPLPRPSARSDAAMCYDSARNRIVMFGGYSGTFSGETWEFDGSAWTQRLVAGPSARNRARMAYDSNRGVCVLVGGFNGSDINDTWEWNGTAWTQTSAPGGEGAGHWSSPIYDTIRHEIVTFAGYSAAAGTQTDNLMHYSPASPLGFRWVLPHPTPPAREYHSMCYDSARNETLLFGGETTTGAGVDVYTRVWDGTAWTARASGPGTGFLSKASVAFDSARGVAVCFGGVRGGVAQSDIWEWNGTSWTLRSLPGHPARYNHAMAYDAARGRIVSFGGYTSIGTQTSSTYTYDGTTWSFITLAGPSARSGAMMAYDAARQRVVLYGGIAGLNVLSDTWEWNGTNWTQIAVSGPGPRYIGAMVYDSTRQKIVLLQGSNSVGQDQSVWEYDGTGWTPAAYVVPAGRWGNAAAFDSARGLAVMFGGALNVSTVANDTWEYGLIVPPSVTAPPVDVLTCRGGFAMFTVAAAGTSPEYQWRHNGIAIDGQTSSALIIDPAVGINAGLYDCIIANSCATLISPSARLSFPACVADVDDGSGTGACDGGVTIEDLLYYLGIFDAGNPASDVDDGTSTGTADGGVTIDDLLYYLLRFDTGC